MGGDAHAGPVAHLHGAVDVDLVDVEHLATVEHGQAGGLAHRLGELDEERPGEGDQAASGQGAAGDLDDEVADAVLVAGGHLLHGAEVLQGGQQPRHRALRQVDSLGDVGHARRPVGQAPQHGEGPLDGLHPGHVEQVFHDAVAFRNVEPVAP